MTLDIVTATKDTFAPFVGQKFSVNTPFGVIELLLDNIKLFETLAVRDNHLEIDGVVHPPRRAFSLTFVGPRHPILAQGMYRFEHQVCGPLDLFVSPFRQDHDGMLYESGFN